LNIAHLKEYASYAGVNQTMGIKPPELSQSIFKETNSYENNYVMNPQYIQPPPMRPSDNQPPPPLYNQQMMYPSQAQPQDDSSLKLGRCLKMCFTSTLLLENW
jgi:hypothetical protein